MYTQERSYNEIVRDNLQEYMRMKGYSTHQLGKIIGVSGMTVSNRLRGVTNIRPEFVDKLCQAFNVSRAEFTTDKDAIPNLSVPAAYPLPILGTICAGDGVLGEENYNGYFFVDRTIKADYCLDVEGDSMIDAHIYHGDIAFIKKSFDFLDGQIYAVRYGDLKNAVLKKVYRQDKGLLLMPCNDAYKPILTEDFLIVGELIGVYHPR